MVVLVMPAVEHAVQQDLGQSDWLESLMVEEQPLRVEAVHRLVDLEIVKNLRTFAPTEEGVVVQRPGVVEEVHWSVIDLEVGHVCW